MATNAWGVAAPAAGAWASAAEEEEEKHGAVLAPLVKQDDFPSLGMAVKVKETKKDKQKKKQTMSLTDFMKSGAGSRQTDDNILMSLPTAPRARAPGEGSAERGLGGGFREYGGQRGGYGRGRDDDDRGPRRDEEFLPSRAEMSDNWGKDRKDAPPSDRDSGRGFGGGGFRDRDSGGGGGFRDRDGSQDGGYRRSGGFEDGPSRADATDNWGASRQFVPSSSRGGFEDRPRGGGGFGDRERGGFGDRDRGYEQREFREPSKADTESRWERKGDFQPTAFEDRAPRGERFEDRPRGRGFGESWGSARDGSRDGPARESFRDRDAGARDGSQDQWKRDGGSAAPPAAEGSEGPRGRPKLNLAPRTASTDKGGSEKGGAAASAASKSNPFGAARPREEVLKEQGRDYRKEELQMEHKAAEVIREETEEERALAKEIEELRVKVEAGEADAPLDPSEGAEGKTVSQSLEECELRLSKLQLELDDKVRYSRQQQRGESRDGAPRREEEGSVGSSGWSRGPPRDEARGYSRERTDSRRYDRDRRPDDRDQGRGYDERDRREPRSYRDVPPRGRDTSRDAGGPPASRW